MGKWRDAFEFRRPSRWDVEYGLEYEFGPPATEQQIVQTEASLGNRLPKQLRELLAEFNGVRYTSEASRRLRREKSKLKYLTSSTLKFLNCDEIAEQFHNLGSDFENVVIFWQDNGFSVMYGVCLRKVEKFAVGSVVCFFDGNLQEEYGYPNLLKFVKKHDKK